MLLELKVVLGHGREWETYCAFLEVLCEISETDFPVSQFQFTIGWLGETADQFADLRSLESASPSTRHGATTLRRLLQSGAQIIDGQITTSPGLQANGLGGGFIAEFLDSTILMLRTHNPRFVERVAKKLENVHEAR